MTAPQVCIPEGSDPAPAALLAANLRLSSTDMRDLLMEFGTDGITATELTQDRREAEWRASGQR